MAAEGKAILQLPESRWIDAHGLRLHYADWGGEGRQPMLLLHGLQDCARLWDFFAEAVQDRYHVIALDHRGHGDSPWADSYRLGDYLQELAEVIEGLDLRDVVLMGHSAGGKNSFIHSSLHPERISRLVIVDMDPDAQNPGSVEMISHYKSESDEYPDLDAVIDRLRSRQPRSSAAVLRHSAVHLTKPSAASSASSKQSLVWKRDRDVVLKYDRPDAWGYLPKIRVPTLIVRGADSTLLRHDVAVRMSEQIPGCRLVEIDGGAHWVHLEQPKTFLKVVTDFLG